MVALAGQVIGGDGIQHRCAFLRDGQSAEQFARGPVRTCVRCRKPATLLPDGAAGPCDLHRQVLPQAAVVVEWFHIAMRFAHALETAAGLGAGTISAYIGTITFHDIEHAQQTRWHGRWRGCLFMPGRVCR